VDLFDNNAGDTLEFASVMLVSGEQGTKVGQPYLPGVTVKAVVQEHGRSARSACSSTRSGRTTAAPGATGRDSP